MTGSARKKPLPRASAGSARARHAVGDLLRLGGGVVTVGSPMKYLGQTQSGSQADTVASRNRFGQYYRRRATPINPKTTKQGDIRSVLSDNAKLWGATDGPTADQRVAWANYAQVHPRVDSLGQTIILSAFGMFMAINNFRRYAGLSPILEPAIVSEGATSATMTWTATAGTPALSGAFLVPSSGWLLQVWAGPQRSPGVAFEASYRWLGQRGSTDTSPFNALAAYLALFGSPLEEGARIFFRSRTVDPNGLPGAYDYQIATVAA